MYPAPWRGSVQWRRGKADGADLFPILKTHDDPDPPVNSASHGKRLVELDVNRGGSVSESSIATAP